MVEKVSLYDACKYLYAEQLQGKKVQMTIESVVGGAKFVSPQGVTETGFDVHFKETKKLLGITGVTVRRQLAMATGTDDPALMVGKRISIYPVDSKKSVAGCAIRIAKAD